MWRKVETRVDPLLEGDVIGRWIERAVFQFHPVQSAMTSVQESWQHNQRDPGSPSEPKLLFSLRPLLRQRNAHTPVPLHSLDPSARVVLQTLTRLVHGGGGGQVGSLFPAHDASTKIVNNGIIWDFVVTKSENKDALCHDTWTVEEGPTITKVIRHHKFSRSRKFVPSEADSTPINPFLFLDKRVTIMQSLGKKGERIEVRNGSVEATT